MSRTRKTEKNLWTVQDAKAGDFLTYSPGDHNDWYLIFHSEYKPYENHFHYYVLYDGRNIYTGGTACIDGTALHPSTPEERDALLCQLQAAGCRWDAERLNLIDKND